MLDIRPGAGSANPQYLIDINGILYFQANDGVYGEELWRSDGTAAGTTLAVDINEGIADAQVHAIISEDGQLYFSARDQQHGQELWTSDGTPEGTRLIKNMRDDGNNESQPFQLTLFNDQLYFSATDGIHGRELWTSDGTPDGTVLVKDLWAGSGDGYSGYGFGEVAAVGDVLYIPAFKAGFDGVLWRSDGTPDGTIPLKSFNHRVNSLTAVADVLFFEADDGVHGRELWKSDGTPEGTVLVKDIQAGPAHTDIELLTAVGDLLFFVAADGLHGCELWRSDGTAAGTILVKDVAPGGENRCIDYESPYVLRVVNGYLLFAADHALWKSDGTTDGTVPLKTFGQHRLGLNEYDFSMTDDLLYFRVNGELWRSDGTADGTYKVIPGGASGPNGPNRFVQLDELIFFQAGDHEHGTELWRSDGTPEGTIRVSDIRPGRQGALPRHLAAVDGRLLFTAHDNAHGRELWRSDGTPEGTHLVADFNPGAADGFNDATMIQEVNGFVYFTATDGIRGFELWKLDLAALATAVEDTEEISASYHLSEVYPNPFNPEARFTLALDHPQQVQIAVYDVLGREIVRLHEGRLAAQQAHAFSVAGHRWASGLYVIRVVGETFNAVRQVVLVK